jgi:hypothetical protein
MALGRAELDRRQARVRETGSGAVVGADQSHAGRQRVARAEGDLVVERVDGGGLAGKPARKSVGRHLRQRHAEPLRRDARARETLFPDGLQQAADRHEGQHLRMSALREMLDRDLADPVLLERERGHALLRWRAERHDPARAVRAQQLQRRQGRRGRDDPDGPHAVARALEPVRTAGVDEVHERRVAEPVQLPDGAAQQLGDHRAQRPVGQREDHHRRASGTQRRSHRVRRVAECAGGLEHPLARSLRYPRVHAVEHVAHRRSAHSGRGRHICTGYV